MWIDAADIQMVLFYLNLATLLCQSWCSKLIYREICVKRSPVGNKEMSALKYGIKYWAKIDRLIAERRDILIHDLLIINWEKSSENMRPMLFVGWAEGQGQDMCKLENAPEIQKYPNFCPWL